MAVTVEDVRRLIDGFAPFEQAENWDNVGILAGSARREVHSILCALELNPMVLDEAVNRDVDLIVTHHPILFRPRKNLCEDDPEGRLLCALVRAGIALIAIHTNFDVASPGVNDALAERLSLAQVDALDSGMRIGSVPETRLDRFRELVSRVLDAPVRCYGDSERSIRRVAVLGGAGGDYASEALSAGADVYLTGEISHHRAWDAWLGGLCVLEAGHAATELPAVNLLARTLQAAMDDIKWNIRIYESEVELFR